MDLSTLGLSEEQLAGVTAFAAGLKAKNDELLGEKKAEQVKAREANEATELAKQLAVDAEKLRLEQANDIEGIKALHAKEMAQSLATEKALTDKATNALNARDKGEVINSILSNVDDRYKNFAKTQLESSVSISYDEAGSTVINIKDGDKQYASSADFLDGVNESETWKHVLTATSLSGANTQQSNGSGNAPQNSIQSNLASRLKANGLI